MLQPPAHAQLLFWWAVQCYSNQTAVVHARCSWQMLSADIWSWQPVLMSSQCNQDSVTPSLAPAELSNPDIQRCRTVAPASSRVQCLFNQSTVTRITAVRQTAT